MAQIANGETGASVRAKLNRTLANYRRLQIIAGKGNVPTGFATDAGGTITNHDIRFAVRNGLVAASGIRLMLGNFAASTPVDTNTGNQIAVRAAMQTNEGSDMTVPWTVAGSMVALLDDKACPVLTDKIGVALQPGRLFGVRLNVEIAAGERYPVGYNVHGGALIGGEASMSENSVRNTGPTVVYDTASIAGSPLPGYTPLAVLGEVSEPAPAVVILGDSIADGSGDGVSYEMIAGQGISYAARGLRLSDNRLIPFADAAMGGQGLNGWTTGLIGLDMHRRMAVCDYANTAFVHIGTNDLTGATTLGAMQTAYQTLWRDLRRRGLSVCQGKIMPRVTGTYTTPEGQTYLNANFSPGGLRDQLNAWFDTQVGSEIDWVVDPNEYVEDPANPCKWLAPGGVAYTSDGVHPSKEGHVAAAQAVRTWAEALVADYGL